MMDSTTYRSLFDLLLDSSRKFKDREAFIYRAEGEEFTVTYEKLFEDVLLLARALKRRKVEKGDRVLFLSENRYAWIVTDMALISLGAISVPRGNDTPPQELEFILEHSGSTFAVVENDALLEKYREQLERDDIRAVFVMESSRRHKLFGRVYPYNDMLEDRTITPSDMEEFLALGGEHQPEDSCTLMYTSGTTGTPKGVLLTHGNLLHQVRSLPHLVALTPEDRWLSVLPTWHIFERAAEYISIAGGSCLVYSSVKSFAADLELYHPTLVATVPRLWESLYSRVNNTLEKQSRRKARLFRLLVATSVAYRRNARVIRNQLPRFQPRGALLRALDVALASARLALLFLPYRLARRKLGLVQERFGGRLRMAISGGGTLPAYLDEWIDAVGIRIANAYGMTECSPAIAGRHIDCHIFGTLGPPVAETEVRVADEDDTPLPPGREGEVQVKGPQVTPGYYDNPEENERAFTPDGFFRTGDLGKFTVSGELVLTGRSKEIIVLASGENVDPTLIESTITQLPFVKDAVLVGQDRKGLGALIIPDMDKLREYVADKLSSISRESGDLLRNRQLQDKVKGEINRLLHHRKGFRRHEKLQSIGFIDKDFQQGEEITSTLKKKRHVIERKYKDLINRIFGEMEKK